MSGYLGAITQGQPWTFVNVDGKRTEYVLEHAENEGGVVGPLARLLNPATGKCAHVTLKWLRAPKEEALKPVGAAVTMPDRPFDPVEFERMVERSKDRDHLFEESLELDRYAPASCVTCGKELPARLTCVACGDEPSEQGEVTRSSVAPQGPVRTPGAPPAEKDVWVRPDVNEALGRVFDGDTGERRRADEAA